MKTFLVKATRSIMMAVVALATVGVFTTLPSSQAQAGVQSACSTWVRLIDISSNNAHPINWTLVARNGVWGAYIKNSENTTYVNEFWNEDTAGATKAGVPWGGYYFARPGHASAVASAQFFVKSGGAKGQLPPVLDLEVNELSGAATVNWAMTWFNTVKSLTGRTPVLYTGGFYAYSSAPSLAQMNLWLAAYPNGYKPTPSACGLPLPYTPSPWAAKGWSIWQYTSVGRIAGTSGNIDVSAAEQSWWTSVTGSGVKPPQPGINKYPAPIYAGGSHGTKVAEIQRILIKQGLLPKGSDDGFYGPKTVEAVKKWQVIIKAKPDGLWSSETDKSTTYWLHHYRPLPRKWNYPRLTFGTHNYPWVRTAQTLLRRHGYNISVDGVWGKQTHFAVAAFQKRHHLPPSGVTGPMTWVELWKR